MKILFWLSSIIMLIAQFYLFTGFVNVYFKNYNGGPDSSGSPLLMMLFGLCILTAGFFAYFTGHIKIATTVMGLPIVLTFLYLLVFLILPYMLGERMN